MYFNNNTELQSTLGNDRDTRMQSMRDRLLRLGKLYSRNDSYFPTGKETKIFNTLLLSLSLSLSLFLAYLIKLLEQHSCQLGWDPGFIPDIFHQVGVSYSTLFTLYNNLFEEKVCVHIWSFPYLDIFFIYFRIHFGVQ